MWKHATTGPQASHDPQTSTHAVHPIKGKRLALQFGRLPSLTLDQRYEQTKQNAQKLDTKLNFPLQLDMTPYTTKAYVKKKKGLPREVELSEAIGAAPLAARSPGWYDLSTVVVHIGKIDSGHYVCYCRRDEQWFKFDDNKVTLAPETQVLEQDAYLLFYIIRNLGEISEKDKEAERERERLRELESGQADAEAEDDD